MAAARVPPKDQLYNRDKITQVAVELGAVYGELDRGAFIEEAMSRLRELELKQRIGWITDCLERHLPADFERAVNLILGSLPAPCDPYRSDGDFGDFIYAPYGEYVARHGNPRMLQ